MPAANDRIPIYTGAASTTGGDHPFAGKTAAAARSLNRARIEALPDTVIDRDILGHTAAELLSARAWRELIRQTPGSLNLEPDDSHLFFDFNERLDDPATRKEACHLAERMGRRLGYLLLMLARGDAANREARPEWSEVHWAYWREVEQVIIAGGLWAGNLGAAGLPATHNVLRTAGCRLSVERSPFGDSLTLIGLARHAPPDTARMLLLDFGHTWVKRATAAYRDGQLVDLTLQSPLPAAAGASIHTPDKMDETAALWSWMAGQIENDWRRHVLPAAPESTAIGISMAAHMENGHPLDASRGRYSRLAALAPHLGTFMRDELAARLGPFRSLALLHDGLAAASAYAGQSRTVVLILGTSIGAGYPPPADGLRPVTTALRRLPDTQLPERSPYVGNRDI